MMRKGFQKNMIFIILAMVLAGIEGTVWAEKFYSNVDYSSKIEKQIREATTSTAKLIVQEHPRIWMKGSWDWDKDNVGSIAWRIVNGGMDRKFHSIIDRSDTYLYGEVKYPTYGRRYLWPILAAEGVARRKKGKLFRGSKHTEDEFLADARLKLLAYVDEWHDGLGAHTALHGAAGYDWLVSRKYSDGKTSVLSDEDRSAIQGRLIALAEKMKADCKGQGQLLGRADHIYKYFYPIIGMALYEPNGMGISSERNQKAKEYLDDFDLYWIEKILSALNEQGGTGGWHGGLCYIAGEYPAWGRYGESAQYEVLPYRVGPLLYAHYTATGQTFENSIYDSGFLKYAGEFWNYMIYPNNEYVDIGRVSKGRYGWIGPMFSHSRRKFSKDPYDKWVAELIGWVLNEKAPGWYVDGGSYDMFDQFMWGERWPSARSAEKLGCGTRHFAKLGWVAMRSGFTSKDDLAALFICQRFHWSHLDPYAQNSFTLERNGKLIKGYESPILIDGHPQRLIHKFPTVSQGAEAYSKGSVYDVGPGIQAFESTEKYDYMKGDAGNAYDSSILSKFIRKTVWLKPNIFVVFDIVETPSPTYQKSWVITPGGNLRGQGSNTSLIDNGNSSLWIKTLLPDDATIEYKNTLKFEIIPKKGRETDYFLNAMEVTGSGKAANVKIASLVEANERDVVGAYIPKKGVVLFSKAGAIEKAQVSFEGVKSGKILIVDLLPSTGYRFSNNGKESMIISSDQGVICLENDLSGSRRISISRVQE
jgi:hypothetical protein